MRHVLSTPQASISKRTSSTTTGHPEWKVGNRRDHPDRQLVFSKDNRATTRGSVSHPSAAPGSPLSVARYAVSLTTLVRLSREPRCFLAAESTFINAAKRAAFASPVRRCTVCQPAYEFRFMPNDRENAR